MTSKTNAKEEERKQACCNYVRLKHLITCLAMRTLRVLFRDRYKILTFMDWENGSLTLNEDFIKEQRSTLELTEEQKKALDSADINKWDFSLLITILQSLGSRISKSSEVEQDADVDALKVLQIISHKVEHVSGQGIPNSEFGQQWEVARISLQCLGARVEDIDRLHTTSKLVSLETNPAGSLDQENLSKSKVLRSRAKELIDGGDFEKGIQLYSEALLLTGLPNGEKSSLYSARSEAYINKLEDDIDTRTPANDLFQNYMAVAMEDANLVTQLQPKWWKGYFLEGKCFQLQKLVKDAIDSFEAALSLNPDSEETVIARDVCRLKAEAGCEDEEHDDDVSTPNYPSISLEHRHFFELNKEWIKSDHPEVRAKACVFMGNRYGGGDGVPRDMNKAAELFREAAEAGSPDGAYHAGLCYLAGVGVKQDIPAAVRYFESAAKLKAKPGEKYVLINKAIAQSKGALGTLCRSGVGKPRDYVKAAEWYTQSAVEGCCAGAANLAGMLSAGVVGIPRDSKRALQYQKLAVELGSCPKDMYALAHLSGETGDLTQARYWFDRAITAGYTIADSEREDFELQLQLQQQHFEELKKKLPSQVLNSGVPIHILYDRYVKRRNLEWPELQKLERNFACVLPTLPSGGSAQVEGRVTSPIVAEIKKLAAEGQEYAKILLSAVEHLQRGTEAIQLLVDLSDEDEASSIRKQELKQMALAEVAACVIAEIRYAVTISPTSRENLVKVAIEFTADDGKKSESDLHARICRLNLSMTSFEEALDFATESKSLYPEQPHFHTVHGKLLGFLKKYDEGLKVIEDGLTLFPDNTDLLFNKAWFLSCTLKSTYSNKFLKEAIEDYFDKSEPVAEESSADCSRQIEAYQEFIRKAPSGHRHIPECYYLVANLYASEGNFEEFRSNYSLGLQAEMKLISSFLPYDSKSKTAAEQVLKLIKEGKRRHSSCSQNVLERLLEKDPEEIEENRKLKVTNPKRILAARDCEKRFGIWEDHKLGRAALGWSYVPSRAAMEGKHFQRAPSCQNIPALKNIRFLDMDPTIDQVYEGGVINLTIMEEYIDWITDCIHSVVKDDNDDFNVICFYNFDRSDPSTEEKLSFGSRIQLMNPYLVPRPEGPAVRVDDPSSVILVSSGEENPMCRYCWKPNPGPRCTKCKTAKYCNRDCQKLDWEILGHKTRCKVLSIIQQGSGRV